MASPARVVELPHASSTTAQSPSPSRRGVKRPAPPAQSPQGAPQQQQQRKWAKHCGCKGVCQAEWYDSECEELEVQVIDHPSQDQQHRRAATGRNRTSSSHPRGADDASGTDPCSESQPPLLLHMLMMF